ncbi:TPA: hypothetical protein ACH3X1_000724 [Trebouxia sp. C0004]
MQTTREAKLLKKKNRQTDALGRPGIVQAQQTREQFSSESSRFWLPAFVALDIRHGRKIEPDSSITSWFIWSMNQIIRFVLTTRQPVLT